MLDSLIRQLMAPGSGPRASSPTVARLLKALEGGLQDGAHSEILFFFCFFMQRIFAFVLR